MRGAPQQKTTLPGQRSPRRSLAGLAWAVSTLARKKIITWQDRWGLYDYSRWIRTVEQPAIRRALHADAVPAGKLPAVCFVITGGVLTQPAVRRTFDTLPSAPDFDRWLVFLLPKNTPAITWLEDLRAADPRLLIVRSEDDTDLLGGLAQQAQLPGEWIVPLFPGDRLSPYWLDLFARAAAQNPRADILYWDEDQLSGAGRRRDPFFKPDWSPELLFSVNYLACAAFRHRLLAENSPGPGGLFALAQRAGDVIHIPFVLQHRAAQTRQQQQARLRRHADAARAYLEGQGAGEVTVEILGDGLRPIWKTPEPLVSIIIPTKNNLSYLRRCLTSLLEKTAYARYELVLMDDHSTEPGVQDYYRELQAQHPNLRVVENESGPFNYSRVNNRGARLAQGDLLLFLNNDMEILSAGWLAEMVRWALRPGVGMVGARLLYPDGAIQHAGIVLGMTGHANHVFAGSPPVQSRLFVSPQACRNVSAVTGACMLVRREIYEQIGGFNEDLSLVFNDVEIGLRVLAHGCRVVYAPAAELIHYEGRSRARYIPPENIRLGADLLREAIRRGDPYYNHNLSLEVNWPSLRRAHQPDPLSQLDKIARYKG